MLFTVNIRYRLDVTWGTPGMVLRQCCASSKSSLKPRGRMRTATLTLVPASIFRTMESTTRAYPSTGAHSGVLMWFDLSLYNRFRNNAGAQPQCYSRALSLLRLPLLTTSTWLYAIFPMMRTAYIFLKLSSPHRISTKPMPECRNENAKMRFNFEPIYSNIECLNERMYDLGL